MVHFAEINQAPSSYSMLQYISDTETCVKKLSQILANNIDNGGRGIGLRIYVRYCRLSLNWHFLFEIILSQFWLLTPYIRALLQMPYSV